MPYQMYWFLGKYLLWYANSNGLYNFKLFDLNDSGRGEILFSTKSYLNIFTVFWATSRDRIPVYLKHHIVMDEQSSWDVS